MFYGGTVGKRNPPGINKTGENLARVLELSGTPSDGLRSSRVRIATAWAQARPVYDGVVRHVFPISYSYLEPFSNLGIVLMFSDLPRFYPNFAIASAPPAWHKVHQRRFAGSARPQSQGLAGDKYRGVIGATRLSE